MAAVLSRRHPLVGLSLYGVIFVNALVHVIAGLARKAIYNPGWLTAVFILPAAVHVGRLHAVRRE
ncbi:HXXEE domain-containing protein [Bradyrhizobium sp.]|uniref:HXXEE domain-containing protein n=1 Tax=Bradyrhizobium sp. TaxID=376 RepID=UPI003C7BFBD6